MTDEWPDGHRWTLASRRLPTLSPRVQDGSIVGQWSGWLWVVETGGAEPWPGFYEVNRFSQAGFVVDGEFGVSVHCWTAILSYPIPWPEEES